MATKEMLHPNLAGDSPSPNWQFACHHSNIIHAAMHDMSTCSYKYHVFKSVNRGVYFFK